MKCPACEHELATIKAGPIEVDACVGGCAGIWFDWLELSKVDEKHESAGEALFDIQRDQSIKVDRDKKRSCPKCGDETVMMCRFFSVKQQVQIDECPRCGGMWLDVGELRSIREEYADEEERRRAAEDYARRLVDTDPAFLKLVGNRVDKDENSAKIEKLVRFLYPPYFLP